MYEYVIIVPISYDPICVYLGLNRCPKWAAVVGMGFGLQPSTWVCFVFGSCFFERLFFCIYRFDPPNVHPPILPDAHVARHVVRQIEHSRARRVRCLTFAWDISMYQSSTLLVGQG